MCYEIALRPTSTSIWRKWGLVIDEISMVDGDYFEEIEAVARYIRKNDTLFGGNQLILKSFLPKPGPGTIENGRNLSLVNIQLDLKINSLQKVGTSGSCTNRLWSSFYLTSSLEVKACSV
ncbi:hypothetical protein pipiens_017278 [Culex pipiens pipiens]|uniref:ATP-dependent DNA helicase n=1 Tax=Culex pipiens pipiens TaxID=38569 RepID=A0ABD1CHI7_CULPP